MLRPPIAAIGGLLLSLLAVANARADERAVVRLDVRDGLPTSDITAIAQDEAGFLWIGTNGGLARFDGDRVIRWAEDGIHGRVHLIAPAGDRLFVGEHFGGLWVVEDGHATAVPGPDGEPIFGPSNMLTDEREALWIVLGGRLWRRDASGAWSEPWSGCFGEERVWQSTRDDAGRLYVATKRAVWRASPTPEACPEQVAEVFAPQDLLVTDTGDLHVLDLDGAWWRYREGRLDRVHTMPIRGRRLAQRGADVWAAYSNAVAVARAGGAVEVWNGDGSMGPGGPLLVDHEGSLWLATIEGLVQYVEPDTLTYTVPAGELAQRVMHISDADDVLIASTAAGSAVLRNVGGTPRLGRVGEEARLGARIVERACRDADGTLWAAGIVADGHVVWSQGGWQLRPSPRRVRVDACTTTPDGEVLLANGNAIQRIAGDDAMEIAESPWPDGRPIDEVLEDANGRLWISAGPEICSGVAGLAGEDRSWTCETLPHRVAHLVGMEESDGVLWAATAIDGLYAHVDGRWSRVPGSDRLPSRVLYALRSSPRGGVWVAGSGVAMRLRPSADLPDGFEILERLSRRHGLIDPGANDILERPDGELWVANAAGLTRIPSHVRARELPPPKVEIVGAKLEGEPLPIGEPVELPPEPGMIELELAALSFIERDRLQFRVQMQPDGAWSEPFDRPVLQLYNPPAGSYALRISASIDGEQWTVAPDAVRFDVAAPLHQRWWFWGLVALAGVGVGWGLHRVRLAVRTRLAHQRLRIAMDLHDDLGSGLGSIGLVADLLARPEVPAKDKLQLAGEISSTASELGDSLRSLVWTLRDERDSLESLAVQLADRAATLLPGDRPRLTTSFPARWPPIELSLAVRRNLQLIAQEALHNAVRHARASYVELGLRVVDDRRCALWIEDDGVGGVDTQRSGNGMGLRNLRRRAEEIGAALEIRPGRRGRGTRVEVVFAPRAADRRMARRGRSGGMDA